MTREHVRELLDVVREQRLLDLPVWEAEDKLAKVFEPDADRIEELEHEVRFGKQEIAELEGQIEFLEAEVAALRKEREA